MKTKLLTIFLLGIICLWINILPNIVIAQADENTAEYWNWNDKGCSLGEAGKHNEAIECFKQAIRIKPDHPVAHHNLGFTYVELKEYKKAIASYKQAIRIKPDFAEAHCSLGAAYAELGDYKRAIASYKEAIRIKPDFAEAHSNLGVTYGELKDYKKAIASFKQAIRIKPDYAGAHNNLGIVYGKLKDYQKEIASYKQAIRLKPDDIEAHYNLGFTYYKTGDRDSAIKEYKILKVLDKEFASRLLKKLVPSDKECNEKLGTVPYPITAGFNLAADKKSHEKPKEYKLTYGVIKNEKDFIAKDPIWLPLESEIALPTKENQKVKVTIVRKGEKREQLRIEYGYATKTISKSGSILKLNLLLDEVKYKYQIRIKFQEGQWVYRRACYMKLKLPEGTLYFFDENTNGRYNDYGIDGVVLPGSSRIIKLKLYFYFGKEKRAGKYLLNLNGTGTKIRLSKIFLQGNPIYLKALFYFNRLRTEAGLPQVDLNETLCRGCELHAKYLDLNGRGHSAHEEDPRRPGYTPEGAKAAKNSCIYFGQPNLITAIDGWMATLYHRVPFLHPGTRTIGMGLYKGVALLDADSDCNFPINYKPIPYPFEGQKGVPLAFSIGERPDPLPPNVCHAGYPITLTFKEGEITDVIASLKEASNKAVEFYFSSPEKPANTQRSDNSRSICLIPKRLLRTKREYTVEIKCKVNGKDFTKKWSFTTR